jgi:hypothetical protein
MKKNLWGKTIKENFETAMMAFVPDWRLAEICHFV